MLIRKSCVKSKLLLNQSHKHENIQSRKYVVDYSFILIFGSVKDFIKRTIIKVIGQLRV